MTNPTTYFDQILESVAYISDKITGPFPETVIVTGTGLASITDEVNTILEIPYEDIPHFPSSTVKSHTGRLYISSIDGKQVAILAGRWHYYEGYTTKELTLPIRVMRALGVEQVIFTNVAGSVNESFNAGDLIVVTDHINFMPDHPLRGANDDRLGVRFPDMLHTYDKGMQDLVHRVASSLDITTKSGIYFALQGPSLETPAEYNMIHRLGADLVGMSTVPEVIVARHGGMKVAAISIVSNVCYPPERLTETTIDEVIEVANLASKKLNKVLVSVVTQLIPK